MKSKFEIISNRPCDLSAKSYYIVMGNFNFISISTNYKQGNKESQSTSPILSVPVYIGKKYIGKEQSSNGLSGVADRQRDFDKYPQPQTRNLMSRA